MVRRTSEGPTHSDQPKKYNINSNNNNDRNNNKCKKVYECLVFIENVFQCSQMSSELRTHNSRKKELICNQLYTSMTLYTPICAYNVYGRNITLFPLFFLCSQMLCSTLGGDIDKNNTILSMGGDTMAAGRILFII